MKRFCLISAAAVVAIIASFGPSLSVGSALKGNDVIEIVINRGYAPPMGDQMARQGASCIPLPTSDLDLDGDDELYRKRRNVDSESRSEHDDGIKRALQCNGLKEEDLVNLPNWINSFVNGKITIPDKATGKAVEYNVVFDASNKLAGSGNFLLGSCPEYVMVPEVKDAKKKKKGVKGDSDDAAVTKMVKKAPSCKRHKMQIFNMDESECGPTFLQTSYDGKTQMNARVCRKQQVTFAKDTNVPMDILVLDGDNFNVFDIILDIGAPFPPRMDGVFSLAFTKEGDALRSGMEQLLAHKQQQIATVYMEPYHQLDLMSPTRGAITVGSTNGKNCEPDWAWHPVTPGADHWQLEMKVFAKWTDKPEEEELVPEEPKPEEEELVPEEPELKSADKVQRVIISTTDAFIFAPKFVAEKLYGKLRAVRDNAFFKMLRKGGATGLSPKDVLVFCPNKKELASLPTLTFHIGHQTFTLTPKEYILPIVLPVGFGKTIGVFNMCHMMIREVPMDGAMYAQSVMRVTAEENKNIWLVGQLFFNKACVAFDYKKLAIGLATSKQNKIA